MMRLILLGRLVLIAALAASPAFAQTPPRAEPEPSRLGPAPGDGGMPSGGAGGSETPLGGRPGPSQPRVPSSVTRPGGDPFGPPSPPAIGTAPEPLPAELPLYGSLSLPAGGEDEGPPDGLTLDRAIEMLIRRNLDLRAQSLEIPQAEADILTAGLRANPVFFSDAQLVPYQSYSDRRPGGATQYDVNVTLPLDLNRKRRQRVDSACRAKRVLEAQYQNAVRQAIDGLYTAYVDVLAARETARYARSSLEGLDRVLSTAESLRRRGESSAVEVDRVRLQRDTAEIGLEAAEAALQEAKRSLVPLLNLAPSEAEALDVRGSIQDRGVTPPTGDDLVAIARTFRPDLVAYRLGVRRAEADVRLARAERFQDVFLLVQPYTFQDNSPFDRKSAHSWAVGVTVPLPIFNRNQGTIRRAVVNVDQTQVELASLEQQVANEVRQAERRYEAARDAVARIERGLLPSARRILDDAIKQYARGEVGLTDVLNARREYNDLVRQYRDTLIRRRRGMLSLNTAVGRRIMP